MAQGTTGEACVAFLAENAKKPGIVVLPCGLQYKVLKHGAGIQHPTLSCLCDFHYCGTFIDGSEFDSSYSRGQPSAFKGENMIEGWKEVIPMMVEGDKWELFIPSDLAYGEAGRPPKMPGNAALIFTMEIVKIKDKDATTPVVFPKWTEEELTLVTEKDKEPLNKWREQRTKTYEEGGLRDKFPTREEFDAWLDKQCEAGVNKSLWTRTRARLNKALEEASRPAPLTKETAREVLTKALDVIRLPENKEKLTSVVKEFAGMDEAQASMMKMIKLMPLVQEMMGKTMKEYGYTPNDLMTVTMQIQALGAEDASIKADVDKLMKAVQGDFAELFA